MQYEDFLKTIEHLSHEDAVTASNAFSITTGHILEASSVNGVLTDLDLIDLVKDISEDKLHPARVKMLGVYTGLLGNHPFNFILSSFTGQRAIDQLDWLIITLPEHADRLRQFKDLMIWRANVVVQPFKGKTLHDVLLGRGVCPVKPVTAINGWVTINTLKDSPEHNPRLLVLNPASGQLQWINNIKGVSTAGSYAARVPKEWLGNELFVDDPFGAL